MHTQVPLYLCKSSSMLDKLYEPGEIPFTMHDCLASGLFFSVTDIWLQQFSCDPTKKDTTVHFHNTVT